MSPNLNLLNRVRSEFIEMPGLRLRIDQAQRLWNLDRSMCESVLRSLVDAKFLGRFEDDLYARYSRSAVAGSPRNARRTGTYAAPSATNRTRAIANAKLAGSVDVTP